MSVSPSQDSCPVSIGGREMISTPANESTPARMVITLHASPRVTCAKSVTHTGVENEITEESAIVM